MNSINFRVSLDMFEVSSQTTIKAKKGDSACKIHITLTEHGKIYKISEGCYATFSAKKSDGNFVYDNCTIEDNSIVYDFSSSIDDDGICQISACEGAVECEVALYKGDSEQLTSPRFTLVIDGTVYNGEDIISTPEVSALKDLLNETKATVEEIEAKLENGDFQGEPGEKGDSGVYVGSGDMPEGCNVQIDPDGDVVDLSDYATKNYVSTEIAKAQLTGDESEIDLSGYATKDDIANINKTVVNNEKRITANEEDIEALYESVSDCAKTEDLSGYATREELDNIDSILASNDVRLNTNESNISDLQNSVEENTHSIETLSNEQTSLSRRISDNEADINTMSVDYIVEQGTSGIWTWEKWASGKAVCWGNVDVYYQDVNKLTTTVDFPFEIIGDVCAQVTKIAGAGAFNTLYATTCYEATSTQIIIALCNSGVEFGESDTLKLSVYVIGKWK